MYLDFVSNWFVIIMRNILGDLQLNKSNETAIYFTTKMNSHIDFTKTTQPTFKYNKPQTFLKYQNFISLISCTDVFIVCYKSHSCSRSLKSMH